MQRGNSVEAIKLLRASTGLGLKEAKDIIDQHLSGNLAAFSVAPGQPSLSPAVAAALQRGNKIEAIRLLREETGLGLKEAKDSIDSFENRGGAGSSPRSPGEVGKSSGSLWLAVAFVALAIIVYYLFRRLV